VVGRAAVAEILEAHRDARTVQAPVQTEVQTRPLRLSAARAARIGDEVPAPHLLTHVHEHAAVLEVVVLAHVPVRVPDGHEVVVRLPARAPGRVLLERDHHARRGRQNRRPHRHAVVERVPVAHGLVSTAVVSVDDAPDVQELEGLVVRHLRRLEAHLQRDQVRFEARLGPVRRGGDGLLVAPQHRLAQALLASAFDLGPDRRQQEAPVFPVLLQRAIGLAIVFRLLQLPLQVAQAGGMGRSAEVLDREGGQAHGGPEIAAGARRPDRLDGARRRLLVAGQRPVPALQQMLQDPERHRHADRRGGLEVLGRELMAAEPCAELVFPERALERAVLPLVAHREVERRHPVEVVGHAAAAEIRKAERDARPAEPPLDTEVKVRTARAPGVTRVADEIAPHHLLPDLDHGAVLLEVKIDRHLPVRVLDRDLVDAPRIGRAAGKPVLHGHDHAGRRRHHRGPDRHAVVDRVPVGGVGV
jgi:hypothetical protein